jgi:hypothetical protein
VESQEPGIISQENAFQVVDKLIAFHDIGLTAEEVKNAEDFNNCEIDARLPQTNVQTGTMNVIVIQKRAFERTVFKNTHLGHVKAQGILFFLSPSVWLCVPENTVLFLNLISAPNLFGASTCTVLLH